MTLPATHASSDPGRGGPVRWHWQSHAAGVAAEPLAREWLAGQLGVTPSSALALARDGRGRPRLGPPHASHDCNWSHSGAGLLIAVGEGVRVGADLERMRPRPRAQLLAERFFTAPEARWLAARDDSERERAFLRLWCAKEAVLKAHGHGLSFGLDRLRFESQGDALHLAACDPALGAPAQWSLREFEPAPGYLAALAWRPR